MIAWEEKIWILKATLIAEALGYASYLLSGTNLLEPKMDVAGFQLIPWENTIHESAKHHDCRNIYDHYI